MVLFFKKELLSSLFLLGGPHLLRTDRVAASLLRRLPDGMWPERPDEFSGGTLGLESIGFSVPHMELYVTTQLYRPPRSRVGAFWHGRC